MLSEITQEASLIGTICEQGPAGEDGKTPIRGVDYWTQADKDEIVQEVSKKVDTSFIVTATTSSLSATTATIDKTLAQIEAAYQAGRRIHRNVSLDCRQWEGNHKRRNNDYLH